MAFLQGLQIGANIGNMRVAQQERMMQLRSQAALNAIHERQLAAQADMLMQNAAHLRMENQALAVTAEEHQADMAAIENANQKFQIGADQIDQDNEMPQEERDKRKAALRDTIYQQTAFQRPGAGKLMYAAIAPEMKQQLGEAGIAQRDAAAQLNFKARELQTKAFQERTQSMIDNLKKSGVGHEAATTFSENVNNWRLEQADAEAQGDLSAAAVAGQKIQDAYEHLRRTHPDAITNLHVKNLQATAHAAYKAYLDTGMRNKKLKAEWERAQNELAKAQEKAPESTTESAGTAKPAASTEKVLVRKDGKTYRLPKEQLEEAKQQGYEEVK